MKKNYYVAYGSNLNLRQMRYRCPAAKLCGTSLLKNYELQFKGLSNGAYATIAPKKGSSVPVAVWEITPQDERSLDRYEGYPSHYFKQNVSVKVNDKNINAMVYVMNLRMQFGLPSTSYYRTVKEGYKDCGLDTSVLADALANSAKQYFDYEPRYVHQHSLFEIAEKDTVDESDPFYASSSMRL